MTRESENNLMAEIAENERWLAQYEAPAPRDGLLDEIKASVRTELSIADDVARMPLGRGKGHRFSGLSFSLFAQTSSERIAESVRAHS